MSYREKLDKLRTFTEELTVLQQEKLRELESLLKEFTAAEVQGQAWDLEDYASEAALALGNRIWVHVKDDVVVAEAWVPSSFEC